MIFDGLSEPNIPAAAEFLLHTMFWIDPFIEIEMRKCKEVAEYLFLFYDIYFISLSVSFKL